MSNQSQQQFNIYALHKLQKMAHLFNKYLNNKEVYVFYVDRKEIKEAQIKFNANNFFHLVGITPVNYNYPKNQLVSSLAKDYEANRARRNISKIKTTIKTSDFKFSHKQNGKMWFLRKTDCAEKIFKNIDKYRRLSNATIPGIGIFLENEGCCLGIKYAKDQEMNIPVSIYDQNINALAPEKCSYNVNKILMILENDKNKGAWAVKNLDPKIKLNEANKLISYINQKNCLPDITEANKDYIVQLAEKNTQREMQESKEKEIEKFIAKLNKEGEYEKASQINKIWQENQKSNSLDEILEIQKKENQIPQLSIDKKIKNYAEPQHDSIESNRNVGDGVVGKSVEKGR